MIIERIDRDEIEIKDETKRFFGRRRIPLVFCEGKSHIIFNYDENTYKIFLSREEERGLEDLRTSYDLVHEIHHLQKNLLFPRWEAGRIFKLNSRIHNVSFNEVIINEYIQNIVNRLELLNENHPQVKNLKEELRIAFSYFIRHVDSLPASLPYPYKYLNVFEDIQIQFHMNRLHPEANAPNIPSVAIDNFLKAFGNLTNIVKRISGFPILYPAPFTSSKELEIIYFWYDILAIKLLFSETPFEIYFKEYYSRLKRFKKKQIREKLLLIVTVLNWS